MQVTEVAAEGLKRQYKVVVPAGEIASRVQQRLERLVRTVRVPGFRPGKAPLTLLKKQYGRAVMGEVLEEAVDEGSRQAIDSNSLRPALRPKVEVTAFDEGKDLEFNLGVEVLPEVPAVDLEAISLTRLVATPDPERVTQAVETFARSRQRFAPPAEARPAREGDQLVIDYEGSVDGASFEGGKAEGFRLVLGGGAFLPGVEAGLVGAGAGSEHTIEARFPEGYGRAELAGRTATFAVKVHEVLEAGALTVDDAWAKELGFDDLAAVRGIFTERFEQELKAASRHRLKRALLDHLAETYRFEVPPGMVELEFEAIWRQLAEEMKRTGQRFAAEGETEGKARAEYRAIAERRVRLGLVLSDIGTRNEVRVEPQELQQAMIAQAQRLPGQERQVFDYFQKTPAALEQLRAPIFEDKVVDFILARAKVEERAVTAEELLREPDEEAQPDRAAVPLEAMS
jgi:trigger factor